MRDTLKQFLNEFMETMPKYKEGVKRNILGWIGYLDEEEIEVTHALEDLCSFDEYIALYKELQQNIENKIKTLEMANQIPIERITDALDYLSDDKVKILFDSLEESFVERFSYEKINITDEDAEMFFEIYEKYYGDFEEEEIILFDDCEEAAEQ